MRIPFPRRRVRVLDPPPVATARGLVGLAACAAALALAVPAFADAPARGYVPRACGFDLDDDGVVGEAEDCRICDAAVVHGEVSGGTADPDGDGTPEDLIYVDCDDGEDRSGCGRVDEPPCKTLKYALDSADGPRDGAEDVVCFRGTCRPSWLTPKWGGVPGAYTLPATGSQTRSFELPKDPAMIVGWDADRDHAYPPFDTDDRALLDGGAPNYLTRTFALDDATNSYFEMAHFAVRGYGEPESGGQGSNLGFMKPNGVSHLYLHDLEADRINADRADLQSCGGDSAITAFNMFQIDGLSYFAIVNVAFTNWGSFWMRGTAGYSSDLAAGPIRVQNATLTAHGWDRCQRGPTLVKLWGYVDGYEFLDSVVDGNVGAWEAGRRGAQGIVVAQCARDFDIVNNSFVDTYLGVAVQGSAWGACENSDARTVDDVRIAGNDFRTHNEVDSGNKYTGVVGVALTDGGDSVNETSEDVTIEDNRMSCSVDCQACLLIDATYTGPSQPGVLTYRNNRCEQTDLETGQGHKGSFVVLSRAKTPRDAYVVRNNTFTGHSRGELAINLKTGPAAWDADLNCYDPDASFVWNRTGEIGFRGWKKKSGGDAHSVADDECPDGVGASVGAR